MFTTQKDWLVSNVVLKCRGFNGHVFMELRPIWSHDQIFWSRDQIANCDISQRLVPGQIPSRN
jgi:hypothetical protein